MTVQSMPASSTVAGAVASSETDPSLTDGDERVAVRHESAPSLLQQVGDVDGR